MYYNLLKKFIVDLLPTLAKYIHVNRGFDHEKEIEDEDHRDDFMGASQPRFHWTKIKEDMDWEDIYNRLPIRTQKWMDCTGEAMAYLLEAMYLAKWGITINLSAAYINKMAGTTIESGNSLTKIIKTVATYGWVTTDEWSEDNRWKTIPKNIIDLGKRRVEKEFVFGYDKGLPTLKAMNEMKDFSPPYTGGAAWLKRGDVYVSFGRPNHCFSGIKHIPQENKIKDTYLPPIKRLAANYKFFTPRRIYLEKRDIEYNKKEIEKRLKDGVQRIMLMERHGEVWELNKDGMLYKSAKDYLSDRAREEFKNGTMIPVSNKLFFEKFIK